MPEAAFDEIVLPEAEPVVEDSFDEIILPHDSGQFEQIVLPKQPKTETEKALAETPSALDFFKNTVVKGLPSMGIPGLEHVATALDYAKEKINEASPGFLDQFTTSPFPATHLAPNPKDTRLQAFGKAALNQGTGLVEGMTSPAMAATVAAGAIPSLSRTVAAGFLADTVRHIPEAYQQAEEARKNTPAGSQEAIEAALNLAGLLTFSHLLSSHVTKLPVRVPEAPTKPVESPEAPPATTEPTGAETAVPDQMTADMARPVTQPEQRMVPVEELPRTESVVSAAIKVGDEIATGVDHAHAVENYAKEHGIDPDKLWSGETEISDSGFLTNTNRFVGLEEASKIAGKPDASHAAEIIPDEPTGVTETIADFENRYGASTEPVIPKEPAGTKFPEPEEIMSPGPGAASAKETLASYELRRFGKRFQETEGINPAIREEVGNRYYEPIPNKVTLEDAGKIIDERGTDEAIRLVRDEKFEMEPRVRATLGQTLVQKLNQSHAEATAAGDTVRAKGFLDQAVDTAEYLGEFGTRLGQGVQSFAIWSRLTPEGMLESAKRSAKRANVELTPEQQVEIRRLAAEAHAAPEGIPKQDATKKLADYMVQQTGIPASDLPLSIYYTHILSGVQTHIVNAVDTALNVMHEVNNLAVTNPRAAASIYGGLMRGLGEGKYDGILSLQEGRRIASGKFIESPDLLEQSKFGKKGGVPIADTGKISRATKRIAEFPIRIRGVNLHPLNAYKYVMRMMSASDAVFFRGAEEARAGLLAHRIAEATGTERAKLKGEVDSILGYDRLPEFRAKAAKEGYTGAKAEARATELMIQSRPESLRTDASDYAGVSTYNHAPRGVLGYLSNQIAQISNKYPALKLFVPFTRIVANVTNRGLDNTPLGIYRALKEKGLSKEERQRVLTRGIMGTAGLMGLGVLNATGAIQVHGAGPSDPEKKRQLRTAGWKPFSIQVGDKYYTYTYTPIGLGVSVLGNYLDSQRYNELSQKDSLTRVAYSMSRIGQTVFSQSFLSGLSNLFTILSGDPGQSVSSLKQFFSNVATGATTPNLLRDVNSLFDPVARKSEGIGQDLIRNIPIARLSLRPALNAFGEPVEVSRNRFFSGQDDDPAWRVVVNKNLRVPVVDQTTFMDSEDGYLYAKIAGERMRKYIVSNLQDLSHATDQQAQDMLTKASRGMFDEARQDVVKHGGVKKKKRKP